MYKQALVYAKRAHHLETMHMNALFLLLVVPIGRYLFEDFSKSDWWLGFVVMAAINAFIFIENCWTYIDAMATYPSKLGTEQWARDVKKAATRRALQRFTPFLKIMMGASYGAICYCTYVLHPDPWKYDKTFMAIVLCWMAWTVLAFWSWFSFYGEEADDIASTFGN